MVEKQGEHLDSSDQEILRRNRSVIVATLSEEELLVIENGDFTQKFYLKPAKLRRLLKTLLKKEFPRSRKVRLYVMGKFREAETMDIERNVV